MGYIIGFIQWADFQIVCGAALALYRRCASKNLKLGE